MSSISKIKTNDITYDVEDTSKQGLLIPGENITIENNVISAQNSYTLPVASNNTLGGVKVGDNLSIDSLGKLSSKNFNIMLKNVSGTVPIEVQSGDKYYNPTTNKIYTYVANTWDSGSTPEKGINYINLENNKIYLYDGTTLKPPAEPMKCYFIETRSEYREVNTITDTIREVYSNVKNNISFGAYTTVPGYVYLAGNATTFTLYMTDIENNVVDGTGTVNLRFSNTIYPNTGFQNYLHMGTLVVTLNIVNDEVDSRTQSAPYIGPVLRPYQNNLDFLHSTEALDIDNRRSYVPTKDFHPSTKKYVDDTIKNKTLLLNYDAGDYDYIYLVAENTFSTSLPSTELKRTSSESNYNMDYTYTSAQTIGPGTRFIFNLALMAGSNAIASQEVALTISIRRSNSALVSINKTLSIPWTSGTVADTTVLNFKLPFNFGLEEPLNIQNGDIFRLTIDSRYVNNMYGYLYSSATDPTYVEQYSNGVSANDVYDKINNVAYSQHEINTTIPDIVQYSTVPTAGSNNEGKIIQYTGTTDSTYTNGYFYKCISDGGVTPTYSWEAVNTQANPSVNVPIYVITGENQASVDALNACCNLFDQGKPFALYLLWYNSPYTHYYPVEIRKMTNSSYMFKAGIAQWGFATNGATFTYVYFSATPINAWGNFTAINLTGPNRGLAEFTVANAYSASTANGALPANNTVAFTPTGNYNPATKKYVDDSIASAITDALEGNY